MINHKHVPTVVTIRSTFATTETQSDQCTVWVPLTFYGRVLETSVADIVIVSRNTKLLANEQWVGTNICTLQGVLHIFITVLIRSWCRCWCNIQEQNTETDFVNVDVI